MIKLLEKRLSKFKIPNSELNNIDQQEDIGLQSKLLHFFKKWSMSTTSHGIPRIVESKSWFRKILWLLCLLVSTGLCAFMCAKGIIEYLQFSVTSEIRIIPQNYITMPVVSICNLNMFLTPEGEYFLWKNRSDPYWLGYLTNDPDFNLNLKQSFGFGLGMFIDVRIRGGVEYWPGWFEWYYRSDYGNCYKVNFRFF